MSYYVPISFKVMEPEEVASFFKKLREETTKVATEIVRQYSYLSPISSYKRNDVSLDFLKSTDEKDMMIINLNYSWIERLFSYRWEYLEDKKTLLVYAIPSQTRHLFDATFEFQDLNDQDYNFDYWKGLNWTEEIVKKWFNANKEEINKALNCDIDNSDYNIDYHRKIAIYNEIWSYIKDSFEEAKDTYITLYRPFDNYSILQSCSIETVKSIIERREELRRMINGEETK